MRIEAAAILHNGKLYTGQRHAEIMRTIWDEEGAAVCIRQDEQGFTTDTGQFLNRFQAGAAAYRSGQTKTRRESLLSEDLW